MDASSGVQGDDAAQRVSSGHTLSLSACVRAGSDGSGEGRQILARGQRRTTGWCAGFMANDRGKPRVAYAMFSSMMQEPANRIYKQGGDPSCLAEPVTDLVDKGLNFSETKITQFFGGLRSSDEFQKDALRRWNVCAGCFQPLRWWRNKGRFRKCCRHEGHWIPHQRSVRNETTNAVTKISGDDAGTSAIACAGAEATREASPGFALTTKKRSRWRRRRLQVGDDAESGRDDRLQWRRATELGGGAVCADGWKSTLMRGARRK